MPSQLNGEFSFKLPANRPTFFEFQEIVTQIPERKLYFNLHLTLTFPDSFLFSVSAKFSPIPNLLTNYQDSMHRCQLNDQQKTSRNSYIQTTFSGPYLRKQSTNLQGYGHPESKQYSVDVRCYERLNYVGGLKIATNLQELFTTSYDQNGQKSRVVSTVAFN